MSLWELQSGALVLSSAAHEIDTSALTIDGSPVPAGMLFEVAAQRNTANGAKDLALLRLGSLRIASGATVKVFGDLPLVVVAAESIEVAGLLDGSAEGDGGGPGATTIGEGGNGGFGSNNRNGGGAGGSFGSEGAVGGTAACSDCVVPGLPGSPSGAYAEPVQELLYAGSRGGESESDITSNCDSRGGGGGGAIQLSAVGAVIIDGRLEVSGGGGRAGRQCIFGTSGGGGGGSGGSIYLESSDGVVTVDGFLMANGGGGGAGHPGEHGEDGQSDGGAAEGGEPDSGLSKAGGDSGFGAAAAQAGEGWADVETGNAGGGGGGVGRITIDNNGRAAPTGTISPAPHML